MRTSILTLALMGALGAHAQIGTANEERFASLKGKPLHVQIKDTSSPLGRKTVDAIRAAWALGPVTFGPLPVTDDRYADPNALFASVESDSRSMEFYREFTGGYKRTATVSNDYFFLEFWSPAAGRNEKTVPRDKDRVNLARTELYYKNIGTGKISFVVADIGTLNNDFCNGLPGYVKNYFQAVSRFIGNGQRVNFKKDLEAQPGIAALQRDTLYVPNYWIGPGGTMLPDEPVDGANGRYITKMLGEYPFPIRLIRRDELSDMILNAKKPLYYLNYVQSSADKLISVVNGLTGEILYTNFTAKSYRPKGKDFADIGKAVAGAK